MNDLTYVQKRVYYSIKDFIEKNGYSPSFREIAKLNGNKGYIQYEDKKSRTVKIVK